MGVRTHRLRHTFITHQLQAGTRLEVVSRAAGHRDSSVSPRLYSHLFNDEDRETAEVTGSVLDRIKPADTADGAQ